MGGHLGCHDPPVCPSLVTNSYCVVFDPALLPLYCCLFKMSSLMGHAVGLRMAYGLSLGSLGCCCVFLSPHLTPV